MAISSAENSVATLREACFFNWSISFALNLSYSFNAADRECGVSGEKISPQGGSPNTSRLPGILDAMTGVFAQMASNNAKGKPSLNEGDM